MLEYLPSIMPGPRTCHGMLFLAKHLCHDSGTALSERTDQVTEIPAAVLHLLQEAQEQLGIYKTGDLDLKVRVSITRSPMLQWMHIVRKIILV